MLAAGAFMGELLLMTWLLVAEGRTLPSIR
jgi:hypothetical protein